MSTDAIGFIVFLYCFVGMCGGLGYGIQKDSILDGVVVGIFWPLFVLKRAWKLLRSE